jgi:hypothetical protein
MSSELDELHGPAYGFAAATAFAPKDLEGRIRAVMPRIFVSPEFARSERLRRFLQFIVDEDLAGRAAQIKAYTIALAVCDRDDKFDPSTDPIVRIEAGRLRRALEHYYLTDGRGDLLRIEVPKGGYRPVITESLALAPSDAPPDDMAAAGDSGPLARLRRILTLKPSVAWCVAGLVAAGFAAMSILWDHGQEARSLRPGLFETSGMATAESVAPLPTIILRPFQTSDMDPELKFFAQGVTEDLVQQLSDNPLLKVRYLPASPVAEPCRRAEVGPRHVRGNLACREHPQGGTDYPRVRLSHAAQGRQHDLDATLRPGADARRRHGPAG